MTQEEKQKYIDTMTKKAYAYAENVLSDVKDFMPRDEYQDAVEDFAQAFVSGGDAAIKTLREILKGEEV